MLQRYFSLMKVMNIRVVSGTQHDTVFLEGGEPRGTQMIEKTFSGGNLKKYKRMFGNTTVLASIIFKIDELLILDLIFYFLKYHIKCDKIISN